ncbi:hypothetical protein O1L44_05035 [Streptomyces noursei]|uniref:hypothetical protein n=1 Tax=Streptomyces noursei TaxID=1971 RepID=UPI0013520AF0|nr:hypothetical protein [Streptomyces noursei]
MEPVEPVRLVSVMSVYDSWHKAVLDRPGVNLLHGILSTTFQDAPTENSRVTLHRASPMAGFTDSPGSRGIRDRGLGPPGGVEQRYQRRKRAYSEVAVNANFMSPSRLIHSNSRMSRTPESGF